MAEEVRVVPGVLPLVDEEEFGVERVPDIVDLMQHLEVNADLDMHLVRRGRQRVEGCCRLGLGVADVREDFLELPGGSELP